MFNVRYHIASLVSVFLALALGLVLGGLIVQRGTFDRQRVTLVEGLRKEFDDLRVENKKLDAENAQRGQLSNALFAEWSHDRLKDRSVIVLTHAGQGEGLTATGKAIRAAGGSVVTVTLLKPEFGLNDSDKASIVASIVPDPERPLESLATSLAAEWFGSAPERPLTDALAEAGILTVTGMGEASASGLLDVAAPEGKLDPAGIALVGAAAPLGVSAAAAEGPLTHTGLAQAAVEEGVPSFNTLGTPVGDYTLIALMSGGEAGYYGIGAGTDALFPPIPR